MIKLAEKFIGISPSDVIDLMNYYNDNCYKFIKASRKYKIKPGDNWCAMFVTVIAHKSGIMPDKFPYEVSVKEQVDISRARGKFTQNVELAKVGDLIVYDWNKRGWPNHIGFIESISENSFIAIEGNHYKTVGRRKINMKSNLIYGIISL